MGVSDTSVSVSNTRMSVSDTGGSVSHTRVRAADTGGSVSDARVDEQSGVVYIKRIAPDGPASREGTLQVTSPNPYITEYTWYTKRKSPDPPRW